MIFSPATLDQVRAASDIVEIVGASVRLKRAGGSFVGLCPFHKEKTPSFHVNPQRQIFHCFGCRKGGDVFRFVQEFESLSFPESVRRLAERAHIPLERQEDAGAAQSRAVRDQLLAIHEQIAQRWQGALANDAAGQIARDYLAQRGVSAESRALFRLGYAPDAWDDTVAWAKSKGHDLATVEQGGLIIRRDGGGYYDRFRGRLMFPICDEQGRVIGFSGRVLGPDEKTAKYVNSPETPIFTKGKVIYGLDKARRAMLDANSVIVCEGQLDLIAIHTAGLAHVVAPQGTALTADHTRILRRYVEEVVLCFDSDLAGQKAAVRALDDLLASGLAIRVATVPAPHDPDSLIRQAGPAAFQELIRNAGSFFDFYLGFLCREQDPRTDRGRLAIARAMAEALRKTQSAVLLDTYAQRTAQRLGVSPDAVRAEFKRTRPHRPAADEAGSADPLPPSTPAPPPPPQEFWLLRLVLLEPALADWAARNLDLAWLRHEGVRRVLRHRFETHAPGAGTGVVTLLDGVEDPELRRLITEAAAEARAIPDPERQLRDVAARLRDQFVSAQIAQLNRRLADPQADDATRRELLQEQMRLRAQRGRPLGPS